MAFQSIFIWFLLLILFHLSLCPRQNGMSSSSLSAWKAGQGLPCFLSGYLLPPFLLYLPFTFSSLRRRPVSQETLLLCALQPFHPGQETPGRLSPVTAVQGESDTCPKCGHFDPLLSFFLIQFCFHGNRVRDLEFLAFGVDAVFSTRR